MQSTENPCRLDGCERPSKRLGLCYGHYMKQWRHGDPRYQQRTTAQDLTGQRFGALVTLERIGSKWRCACDCGREAMVRTGDLNRGTQTCGDRTTHHRRDVVGIGGAHMRVRAERGSATKHTCVDCGGTAAHWSYDHEDPEELQDASRGPYSLNTSHYEARCVPCHKRFDLDHLAA